MAESVQETKPLWLRALARTLEQTTNLSGTLTPVTSDYLKFLLIHLSVSHPLQYNHRQDMKTRLHDMPINQPTAPPNFVLNDSHKRKILQSVYPQPVTPKYTSIIPLTSRHGFVGCGIYKLLPFFPLT